MINTIVLSGGSTKGFCYIGVLQALEELDMMKNIKKFQGTSVGGIFATFFAMGFTSKELYNYLSENIDYTNSVSIDNFLDSYGFYDGKEIVELFENIMAKKYKKDITFKELRYLKNNTLTICVTNLNCHKIEYLSYKKYPDMKISDAIRYAITIPFVFNAKQYKDLLYIDAAIINNISLKRHKPENTIAFIIRDRYGSGEDNKIDSLEGYIKNIFRCMSKNHFNNIKKRKKKYNLLELNCDEINQLDFALSDEDRKYLYDIGYNKAIIFGKRIKNKNKK